MKHLTPLLSIALLSLSLGACKKVTIERPAEEETASEARPAKQDESVQIEIEELEREVETSKQIIEDLEAAVLMERAKVQDDPDYDQSFLLETLEDQQREREDIEEAQKRIEALKQ